MITTIKQFCKINESSNSRFYQVLEQEIANSKKIMVQFFPSVISDAMNKSGTKVFNQEIVNNFIDLINEYVFGGIEPEDASIEWYKFWDELNESSFLYANEQERTTEKKRAMGVYNDIFGGNSPYKDKNIRYLTWSKEMDEKIKNGEYSTLYGLTFYVEYGNYF